MKSRIKRKKYINPKVLMFGFVMSLLCCTEDINRSAADYECELPIEDPSDQHPRADQYEQALAEAVYNRFPGAILLIRDQDGLWIGAEGFADLDLQVPMRACHRTRIASVTKSFVAVTILLLVEEGLLSLDDSLTDVLDPGLANQFEHAERITIRQLLNHTSGIADYIDFGWILRIINHPTETWTVDECIERGAELDRMFSEPGQGFSYSNTGYLLLGKVIESVTGRPHEEIMADRLFYPLGLTDTTYRPDVFDFTGVIRGYQEPFGDRMLVDSSDTYSNDEVGADGGIVSTVYDLHLFIESVFRNGDLLSESTLASSQDWVVTDFDDRPEYGLGLMKWVTPHGDGIGHSGDISGYQTELYYFPEADMTFVFAVNVSSMGAPNEHNLTGEYKRAREHLIEIILAN